MAKSDFELEGYGRLTHPMKYDPQSDTFRPVEWDDAFARIGEVLRVLSPDQVEFYTSGRASNEAAFLYQLFARELGTNNFPDCSNMCHQATSVGLPRSIGIGKGTVSLEDFDHTELVISIGHNPGTNHPRMMGTLHELARRGVPIIVFNPLRETALERFADPQSVKEMATYSATDIASTYYQVKAGGDAAALKGIAKHLLALDALDHDFIATQTQGFTAFAADIAATPLGGHRTRVRPAPRRPGERGADLRRFQCHHHYLRHGDHPAQQRYRQRAPDCRPAVAAWQFR